MNKLRKIQLFILVAMVVLISIVIGNFNSGEKPNPTQAPSVGNKASRQQRGNGTRMERGVHVLYRDGKPYATVHFKEAVQGKKTVNLTSPVLEIAGVDGKVTAESALIEGDLVVLQGKISLLSSRDGISVSLSPPATLNQGVLIGAGKFAATINNGLFSGTGYRLPIADHELVGIRDAMFTDTERGFQIQAVTGIANLKSKTLTFVKDVQLNVTGNSTMRTTTDMAFLNTVSGVISLAGRGRTEFSEDTNILFSEGKLKHNSGKWSGSFPEFIHIIKKDRIFLVPNAILKDSDLSFPWAVVRSKDGFLVNTGPGSYSLRDSEIKAVNPIGMKEGEKIYGTVFSWENSGQKGTIFSPVLRKQGYGWISGDRGILHQNGTMEVRQNVHGQVQDRQFSSDTAVVKKKSILMKNAVVWDRKSQSFSIAGQLRLKEKNFFASDDYQLKQLRGKKQAPFVLTSENAEGNVDGPSHLFGNVITTMENLTVQAPQSYVYRWGAVFFNADFHGKQVRRGYADLLIVIPGQHIVRMLGNSVVTDKNGNRIVGHKLTLSTITGRISVYSGKEKVKVKLAL